MAQSPDGNHLVYVANQRLYLRAMSGLESRVIAGSEIGAGVVNPVFSPDGQALAFFSNADRTLKRLAISGGAAVTICAADTPLGVSWDEQGIVFGQSGKGILRVSPNGGTPEVIAAVGKDEVASAPQMLPGGRAVLFSVKKTVEAWDKGQIVVQPLGSGERKTLIDGGASGRYVPTGHLVYALSGTLLAVPFDLDSLAVSGGPVPIVEGVRRFQSGAGATTGVAHFSFSSSGTLAYWPGPNTLSDIGTDLALFSRNGNDVQPLKLPPGQYSSPRVSADGKFVAFERTDGTQISIWVYELAGGRAAQQFTFGGNSRAPVWSPDGQSIAFQSDREGDLAIFRQRADGSGTAERLTKPEASVGHTPQSWARDGAHLLFSVEKSNQSTLWTMTVKDRQIAALGDIPAREAAFSPDGRWVAYQVGNPSAVYLEPFPRTGAKYLVPQSGGHPFWSPKGDEIIMNTGPTQSRVIAVTTTPRVSFGRPAEFPRIGRTEPNPQAGRRNVDMMPDGQHVIGVPTAGSVSGEQTAQQITVIINWFDELRQRVPVR
ncbi:MAG: hypothetical protein A3H97_12955 [Acidobacteria bacterium RIFCSPLOWO2_02_FULL_65_29]|nr:MAG: hypothetical protein A3H97_12955 [Acidobacteria bacterium RIFCSPLOWO2_02_FULL_65_29]